MSTIPLRFRPSATGPRDLSVPDPGGRSEDPAHNTKYARIQYLIDKGYIRYVNVNGKPTKKLQLTEKGERIAECIDTMHGILRMYGRDTSIRANLPVAERVIFKTRMMI